MYSFMDSSKNFCQFPFIIHFLNVLGFFTRYLSKVLSGNPPGLFSENLLGVCSGVWSHPEYFLEVLQYFHLEIRQNLLLGIPPLNPPSMKPPGYGSPFGVSFENHVFFKNYTEVSCGFHPCLWIPSRVCVSFPSKSTLEMF